MWEEARAGDNGFDIKLVDGDKVEQDVGVKGEVVQASFEVRGTRRPADGHRRAAVRTTGSSTLGKETLLQASFLCGVAANC